MIVIDSSAWVEFFTRGPAGDGVREYVGGDDPVAVPAVVVYEVFRAIQRMAGDYPAAMAAAQLTDRGVVDIDASLALAAAHVAAEHGLHMADAMIYATTLSLGGTLVTLDAHFDGLPDVVYLQKRPPRGKAR